MKLYKIISITKSVKKCSKNLTLKNTYICIFQLFLITIGMLSYLSNCYAGEISCRYYSNHNKNENMGLMSDVVGGIADLFTGGAASSISRGATAMGIASQVDDHKIYCTFLENNESQENSNTIFYNLLNNMEIVPVFLYENLAQKKIEQTPFNDINTPFSNSERRDKSAAPNEFVFGTKTAISDIKYFGFIMPKTNSIIMFSVNPKTLQLRDPNYRQWKEINEEYFK